MDKNTLLYYQSARALKLPVTILPHMDAIEVKLGRQRYFFRGGYTPFNSVSSANIANDKFFMNKILKNSGFPVPKAIECYKEAFEEKNITDLIQNLTFPLVVKPTIGTLAGQDVLCNISTLPQLTNYMKQCYDRHSYLSVEEFHSNLNSYRVLVFYNNVIGVVQRFPARIVGDGIHTIQELVAITNKERDILKNTTSLEQIKIDEECQIRLNELGITVNTIPKDQELIVLCYTCNSSRGGTMKSLGKSIHKRNAQMLCNAAGVLGLNYVGFDVACEDILIPFKESRGVIIEANYNPDITIHENPTIGKGSPVSPYLLRRLIIKHPLAYLLHLYRTTSLPIYIKVGLCIGIFLFLTRY